MKQNKLAKIFDNWVPKIISLIAAALLFYLYNVSKYDTRVLIIPLEHSIADTLALVNPLPATVRVTLKGESNVIYSIPEDDISAYVNLSSYTIPGTYRVPIRIEKKGSALAASFLEYTLYPLDVEAQLDKKITKKVPV
ncbi:MAG TPA: CdaR family protein, partial [Spirochaetales bacterium]|nr:CdaR family protein [Spirochaetales bacterium]